MKPLYATIAATGGLYTLTYAPDEQYGAASKQGYDTSVFDQAVGSGVPCVDFTTMDFDGYRFPCIKEAHAHFNERYTPLADWIADVQARGATVTYL